MTHRLVTPPRLVASALCCALGVSVVSGAAVVESKRSYNLPSGDAASTLNQFAGASGQQIIFMMDKVKGERTNAITGAYAAHEALDRMLAGTGLSAARDPATGAFVVSRKPQKRETGPVSDQQPKTTEPPAKPMYRKNIIRAVASWLAVAMSSGGATIAAEASATANAPIQNGSIIGSVSNRATRQNLSNAEVRVEGRPSLAYSDSTGSFSLGQLPPGTYAVTVSYPGLKSTREVVMVAPGKNTLIESVMTSDAYVLDAFTVSGEREGRAAALAAQRQTSGIKNMVAADEYQNVVSGNIGELLRNVSGVSVDYAGSDPRAIRVRGINPNLNTVTVDGNRFANAASGGRSRQFDIDQTSLQNYEMLEVTKAPTPDMEANSIGGNVNLVSKSAFSQKGQIIRFGLNFNVTSNNLDGLSATNRDVNGDGETNKIRPGGTFLYSNFFGVLGDEKNLGVVLTYNNFDTFTFAYRINKDLGRNALQPNAKLDDINYARISSWYLNDAPGRTHRKGYSLNLDYKLSPNTTAHLYTQANSSQLANRTRQFRWNANTYTADSGQANTTALQAPNNNVVLNVDFNDKSGNSFATNPGVKHVFGPLTINYDLFISQSTNHYRDLPYRYSGINMSIPNIGFTLTGREDAAAPAIRQTSGNSVFDLTNYGPMQLNSVARHATDEFAGWKFDVKREFGTVFPFSLKTGANGYDNFRAIDNPRRRWTYTGPSALYAQFLDSTNKPGTNVTKWDLPQAPWFSPQKITSYFNANPNLITEDKVFAIQQESGRSTQHERIAGAYFMGNIKLNKLTILAGVRREWTSGDGSGQRVTRAAGIGITDPVAQNLAIFAGRVRRSYDYSNNFGNLQFKYDLTNDIVVRLSGTESIGRPDLGNILPNLNVDSTNRTLSANNPNLKPQKAQNMDFSIEYYLPKSGVISAGVFRKNIRDYIAGRTIQVASGADNGFDGDYAGFAYNTAFNIGSATVRGYEVNLSRPFSGLPGWMSGLGGFANGTWIKTEGNYGGNTTSKEIQNFIPRTINAGLYYTRGTWNVSAKWNHRGSFWAYDSGGLKAYQTSWNTIDVAFSKRIWRNYEFTMDARNLFNERTSFFVQKETRYIRQDPLGASINLGLKAQF